MKQTTPHWIAIGLLVTILAGGVFKILVLDDMEKSNDGRTAVILESAERQGVLVEMRMLLETMQTLVAALADDDLASVEAVARPLGSSTIGTVDSRLRDKLPLKFKVLGFDTHYAFDDIANMAKEGKPSKAIQKKLAETMSNCIECHASFQLPEKRI